MSSLSESITLPSGLILKNRLVKAALAESMSKDGQPSEKFNKVYSEWGSGGWGAILTGNVMVDERFLGSPGDLVVESDASKRPVGKWKAYAAAVQREGTPAIVQLNHPGRQSPLNAGSQRGFWDKTIAPSAIGLNIGDSYVARAASALLFGTPKEMALQDIRDVTFKFADAAKFTYESGFAGIELHAAHGYLLAQFLSPQSNTRTDAYGGTAAKRAKIVVDIIREIRTVVPKSFTVGIKLNSADHQRSATLKETMDQIALIIDAGVDFIEISGGSYEDPQMMQANAEHIKTTRSSAREAFFLDFAKELRQRFPSTILMLTGGFRTRAGMESALAENACDIIGLGRPGVINPNFPKEVLLNEKVAPEEAQMLLQPVGLPWLISLLPIKVLGAGAETTYYAGQIHRIAKGLKPLAPAQARL